MAPTLDADTPSTNGLQLTRLLGFMDSDHQAAVVTRALSHRKSASEDTRRMLESSIRDSVKVNGFKNPDRAPASHLREPVLHQLPYSESLLCAVLRTWAESHAELMATVSTHLTSKGVPIVDPDFVDHSLKYYWPNQAWESEQMEILELHRELDQRDVALMLCYVTGQMPTSSPDMPEESHPSTPGDILNQVRSFLDLLQPDSPLWDTDVRDFIDSVSQLRDAKLTERERTASQRALGASISQFLERHIKRLAWLEVNRVSWEQTAAHSFSTLTEVPDLLQTLGILIDQYDTMPVDGSSMAESERLMEQKAETLRFIRQKKMAVDEALSVDDGSVHFSVAPILLSDEPPLAIYSQDSEPSTDATLSKLELSAGDLDFNRENLQYAIDLDNSVDKLDIIPATTSDAATIEVTVESPGTANRRSIESSDGRFRITTLGLGQTTVAVTVVAEDGETTQTYTVVVNRAASTDSTLADLQVSDGDLGFEPLISHYQLEVANNPAQWEITPVASDDHATIHVSAADDLHNLVDVLSLPGGRFGIVPLPSGQTRVSVVVTAQEQTVSTCYTILVKRLRSANATLKSLELSAGNLEFDSYKTGYNIELSGDIHTLAISPVPVHPSATVTATVEYPARAKANPLPQRDGIFEAPIVEAARLVVKLTITAEDELTTQDYVLVLICQSHQRKDLEELMASLVQRDDIAGAYWIARSLHANGMEPSVPPSLLMAVQGARWLSPLSNRYVEDLARVVSEIEPTGDADTQVLLGLAASVYASLIAPETNLLAWLSTPNCVPGIEEFLSPIKDFASKGYALRPALIRGDEGTQRLEALIAEASIDTRTWWEESGKHRHKLQRATNAWQALRSAGVISEILTLVVTDRRDEVELIRSRIRDLEQDSYLIGLINEVDKSLLGSSGPKPDIVGAARSWVFGKVRDATTRTARWCELVERQEGNRSNKQDGWVRSQVSGLRSHIQLNCRQAFDALEDVARTSPDVSTAAAAHCATRSLQQLIDYLQLIVQHGHLPAKPSVVEDSSAINTRASIDDRVHGSQSSLEVAIARRLLWVPAIQLDDTVLLSDERQLTLLGQDSLTSFANDVSLESIMRTRSENGDFRFFELLSLGLPPDQLVKSKLTYSRELRNARTTLVEHIRETREDVDRATKDGVIEYEGAEWTRFQGHLADLDVEHGLDLRSMHDILDSIQEAVRKDREQRRNELIEEWETLYKDSKQDNKMNKAFLDEMARTVGLASTTESLDIRVMEDCVSRLRNHRSGEHLSSLPLQQDLAHNWLEDFVGFCDNIPDPKSHVRDHTNWKQLLRQLNSGG